MPAYEYCCESCGEHFERRQKMSDPEVEACPDCGSGVKRLISGGAGAITGRGEMSRPACGEGACCMNEMGCGSGQCMN
jgi:putative FmdB family regulatory protein